MDHESGLPDADEHGLPLTSDPPPANDLSRASESGCRHVWDAMKINARRGPFYARITRGRSLPLTLLLLSLEALCLPFLAVFDGRARKYNRRGIPIVRGDFVGMGAIPDAATPLRLAGCAGGEHRRALREEVRRYGRDVRGSAWRGDFRQAAGRTRELLGFVRALEERSGSLHPMTRHTLESVGLAASHAVRYAEQSSGETTLLSKAFVLFQSLGVAPSPWIDRWAQACHVHGAGIVENDVPPLPFEDRLSSLPPA